MVMINMRTEFLIEECLKFDQKKSSEFDQSNKKLEESHKRLKEIFKEFEKQDFSRSIDLITIYGKE